MSAFIVSITTKILPLKKFQLNQDEVALYCLQIEQNTRETLKTDFPAFNYRNNSQSFYNFH